MSSRYDLTSIESMTRSSLQVNSFVLSLLCSGTYSVVDGIFGQMSLVVMEKGINTVTRCFDLNAGVGGCVLLGIVNVNRGWACIVSFYVGFGVGM